MSSFLFAKFILPYRVPYLTGGCEAAGFLSKNISPLLKFLSHLGIKPVTI